MHLRVLEGAGLVTSREQGRDPSARLERGALELAERRFADRRSQREADLDGLAALLDEEAAADE